MKTYFLYVSHKSPGLGLEWLGKARSIENYKSEIYSKNRYGQVSCGYLICETETESYEITDLCLYLTAWVFLFNIYHRSWLFFFCFFNEASLLFYLTNYTLI